MTEKTLDTLQGQAYNWFEEHCDLSQGTLKKAVWEWLGEDVKDEQRVKELKKGGILQADAIIQIEYPQKFISDTSDLRRKLPKIPIDGEKSLIEKMGVSVVLKPNTSSGIVLSENLTYLDLLVYMGICTWIDRGIGPTIRDIAPEQRYFTPKVIYNCINPNSRKDLTENSPEIIEIEESIDKLRNIKIQLDYSGFFKGKSGQETAAKYSRETQFINADKIIVETNGQRMTGYELQTVPTMYWASKRDVKQLATYDRKLLETPTIKDSNRNFDLPLLKHDILTHIQTLKAPNGKRLSRKIKYQTLFERNGISPKDKAERKRRRDQVKKYLDYLVKEGEIKGYAEYKSGREIIGIEFIL